MSTAAGASSPDGAGTSANTGRADQYVPTFDNQQKNYKEFRRRCELYRVKMNLAGRQKETTYNIVTMLYGKAWDLVDDLEPGDLEGDAGFKRVFDRLDKGFKFDAMTELPEDFETFFVRLARRPNQTLQEYAAEFSRSERHLRITHNVDLPEKIKSWWFLRRSGITKDQRQLILTNIGSENLTMEATQKAMNFILGQDSRLDAKARATKLETYYQEDEGGYDMEPWNPEEDYAFYQDNQDYDNTWLDYDQDYYEEPEHEGGPEDAFDVEEFDEIYTSYTDAKARLNGMRMARGFYPVVAMIDKGSGRSLSPSKGSKGEKGKSKNRGKGKGTGKQMPQGTAKGKSRGHAAIGRQICLRCGQAKHWARNCPQSSNEAKKRKTDEAADEVMMVAGAEMFSLDKDDLEEDEPARTAVQDGGASSVLGSSYSVRRYMMFLLEQGYDVNTIEAFYCDKGFRYGNSSVETTQKCILLPVVLGGRKLKVLTYVIQGTAPLLFGRPVLEQLQISVDYGMKRMRWPGCPWHEIPLGPKGEHLLNLVEDVGILLNDHDYERILVPTDYETHIDFENPIPLNEVVSHIDGLVHWCIMLRKLNSRSLNDRMEKSPRRLRQVKILNGQMDRTDDGDDLRPSFTTFLAETDVDVHNDLGEPNVQNEKKQVEDPMVDVRVKMLSRGKLHGLILSATEATKRTNRMPEQAKVERRDKKVIWEVFAGEGRTTKEARRLGANAESFSKHTGWDFEKPKDRRRFLSGRTAR